MSERRLHPVRPSWQRGREQCGSLSRGRRYFVRSSLFCRVSLRTYRSPRWRITICVRSPSKSRRSISALSALRCGVSGRGFSGVCSEIMCALPHDRGALAPPRNAPTEHQDATAETNNRDHARNIRTTSIHTPLRTGAAAWRPPARLARWRTRAGPLSGSLLGLLGLGMSWLASASGASPGGDCVGVGLDNMAASGLDRSESLAPVAA